MPERIETEPTLRVTRGNPTEEELVALVVALRAVSHGRADRHQPARVSPPSPWVRSGRPGWHRTGPHSAGWPWAG